MIISRTPFRISFGGGGTDIRNFYEAEPGAVISTTISKYMYIFLNRRFDGNFRASYSQTETVERAEEFKHPIIRECLKLLGHSGVDMASIADIPEASGLGSSSSFTVGLLHAISAFKGRYIDKEELAKRACEVEIEKLGEPIGKQDQFAVAFGGLNLIEFNPDESVEVKPVLCSSEIRDELNQSLMLIFTGIKGKQASEILSTYKFNKKRLILREMRELAYEMKECLEDEKDLNGFGLLLDEDWKLKQKLSKEISNTDIEMIYRNGKEAGALGGKLLGAGGRGFLLFFVEKHNRQKVREAIWPLREVPFRFESEGSRIVYVGSVFR